MSRGRPGRYHERITAILDQVYDLLPAAWDSWGRHGLRRSSDVVQAMAKQLGVPPWEVWKAIERLRGEERVQRIGYGRYAKSQPVLREGNAHLEEGQDHINLARFHCEQARTGLAKI